jgi:hypothetical protein
MPLPAFLFFLKYGGLTIFRSHCTLKIMAVAINKELVEVQTAAEHEQAIRCPCSSCGRPALLSPTLPLIHQQPALCSACSLDRALRNHQRGFSG